MGCSKLYCSCWCLFCCGNHRHRRKAAQLSSATLMGVHLLCFLVPVTQAQSVVQRLELCSRIACAAPLEFPPLCLRFAAFHLSLVVSSLRFSNHFYLRMDCNEWRGFLWFVLRFRYKLEEMADGYYKKWIMLHLYHSFLFSLLFLASFDLKSMFLEVWFRWIKWKLLSFSSLYDYITITTES